MEVRLNRRRPNQRFGYFDRTEKNRTDKTIDRIDTNRLDYFTTMSRDRQPLMRLSNNDMILKLSKIFTSSYDADFLTTTSISASKSTFSGPFVRILPIVRDTLLRDTIVSFLLKTQTRNGPHDVLMVRHRKRFGNTFQDSVALAVKRNRKLKRLFESSKVLLLTFLW